MSNVKRSNPNEKSPEIAIYGAGSMGTVLGAFLSRAGLAVDLIGRDKAHIEALKTTGAKIGGTVSFSVPSFDGENGRGLALLSCEMANKYDIIFLLTKQAGNTETAVKLKEFLSPSGIVCTLQNGIPEPALAEVLGEGRVLGCICVWGASLTAPGCADLTSNPAGMVFNLEHREVSHNVKAILEKACPVTLEANFTGTRWSKLMINAAFSGTSAVTGFNFGQAASNRRSRNIVLNVVKECINVCRAAGIAIKPINGKLRADFFYFKNPFKKWLLSFVVRIAIRNHRAIRSGMLKDIDRGRKCEVEFINGEVCRVGRKYGVPTPWNDWIVETVHSIERGERRYEAENLEL